MEEEDAALAAALSKEQKSGQFLLRKGKAFFKENKCGIYKFMNDKHDLTSGSSASNRIRVTSEVNGKLNIEKNMKKFTEHESSGYLETVKNLTKNFPSTVKPSGSIQQKGKVVPNGPSPDCSISHNSFFLKRECLMIDNNSDAPTAGKKSPSKRGYDPGGSRQGGNRDRHENREVIELINCCDDDDNNIGDNTSQAGRALPQPTATLLSSITPILNLVHDSNDTQKDVEVIIISSGCESSSSSSNNSSSSSSSSSSSNSSSSSSSSSSSGSSSSSSSADCRAERKVNNSEKGILQHSEKNYIPNMNRKSTHSARAQHFKERKRPWEPDPHSTIAFGRRHKEYSSKKDSTLESSPWNCTACTYNNKALSLSCAICGMRKKEALDGSIFHLK